MRLSRAPPQPMTSYIIHRLIHSLPVLLGALLISFLILHVTPGDPAQIYAGEEAKPEVIEAIRKQMGLDKSLPVQFFVYVGNVVRGDLGKSYFLQQDVAGLLGSALPRTATLASISLLVTLFLGVPAGIIAAVYRNKWQDSLTRVASLVGVSVPAFFGALLAILVFSRYLGWFPSFGATTWKHFVLPGVSLGIYSTALVARLTRSSMLNCLEQDYVRTARSKGLRERVTIGKHALRNASIPIATIVGLQLGHLLGGSILTETVFSFPGIGRLMVQSIFAKDFPVVQGIILVIACTYVAANLITDLFYAILDPRIEY